MNGSPSRLEINPYSILDCLAGLGSSSRDDCRISGILSVMSVEMTSSVHRPGEYVANLEMVDCC